MDFAQQERGGVMIVLATAKGRATIFHARPCWGYSFSTYFFKFLPPPPGNFGQVPNQPRSQGFRMRTRGETRKPWSGPVT
jgi:hypothetical protein